ncbi:MAG: hypothetical protein JNM27_13695 [Leptospirales bacterium]|nr:hypothetical protein [Leptospirales bacterium]
MIFRRTSEAWKSIAPLDLLGELLSEISQQAFAAGWTGGTEYFVPELCRRAIAERQIQYWGLSLVSPDLGRRLFQIADLAGSWVDYENPDRFVPFNPFPIPQEYLEEMSRPANVGRRQPLPTFSPKHLQLFLSSDVGSDFLQGLEVVHPE